jgi:1,4-dihydroxy-2-naphthoate octaprenyltransferase
MPNLEPSIIQMLRAPFFSSILAPLLAGSFLAAALMNSFNLAGFLLVLIMGLGLHAATNVYNDIYDTKQGTDKINRHRNEFSGGSGIIIQYPHLLPKMYNLARTSLIIALSATIGLMFVVDKRLWGYLWALYLLSAFFSKYYTAAPPKLSYRGIGEISVWFAFGPMAILVASVSQNLGFHDTIILAMPPTGISTLSILLIGELLDYPADKEAGKWGVAVRWGTQATAFLYVIVQTILFLNILILSLTLGKSGLVILLCIIPYLFLLPSIIKVVVINHDNPAALQPAAKQNVQLHLLFSILLTIGLLIYLIL